MNNVVLFPCPYCGEPDKCSSFLHAEDVGHFKDCPSCAEKDAEIKQLQDDLNDFAMANHTFARNSDISPKQLGETINELVELRAELATLKAAVVEYVDCYDGLRSPNNSDTINELHGLLRTLALVAEPKEEEAK